MKRSGAAKTRSGKEKKEQKQTGLRTHDNTMMGDWNYCERKYALRHVLNQTPVDGTPATSFGKLMHRGWDKFYQGLKKELGWEDSVVEATELMGDIKFIDPLDDYRTKGRAIITMLEYATHWKNDPGIKVLYTEIPFELEDETGFRWGGIIDTIVEEQETEDQEGGDVADMDHKTTTRFDKYYFDNYKRDPQMLGYTHGGSLLHGQKLRKVLINLTALRQEDNRFFREAMTYPDWLVAEWKAMVQIKLKQIEDKVNIASAVIAEYEAKPLDVMFDTDIWVPNLHNCVGKFGRCPFYALCHTAPEKREKTLYYDYKESRWDWTQIDD